MKFKNKDFVDKSGLTRTIEYFAFSPITIDGETRWLERVVIEQSSHEVINNLGDRSIEWFNERFLE